MVQGLATLALVALCYTGQRGVAAAGDPFLKTIDNKTHVIGNDLWNLTIGQNFGTKLWYKGHDLVGNASGHYVSYSEDPISLIRLSRTSGLPNVKSQTAPPTI
jgi:hypothetical protein